ncbi:MAG: pilin [Candidatus Falkowbacteria bacterium]
MKKTFFVLALSALVILPVFAFGLTANAQSAADNMLWGGFESNVQTATGLGNTDPREMAGSVINIFLGFLGIIAVLLILFGGFKWMTAAGDEGKVDEAKKLIAAGIIGLVVILAAFAIAQFVINALYNATNATG